MKPVKRRQYIAPSVLNDLRDEEDEQRQHGRGDGEHLRTPQALRLGTDTRGANGMSDGVEAEDRREWAIDVQLELAQPRANLGPVLLELGEVGRGDAE